VGTLGITLNAMKGYHPDKRRSVAGYERFLLPGMTRESLKRDNVCLDTGTGKYETTGSQGTCMDEIIFSGKPGTLFTTANACFSYILFSKQSKLAAAAHVFARHVNEPEFHVKTVQYALANLKNMAPKAQLSAHICGGYALYPNEVMNKTVMFWNKEILWLVINEMLNWGVMIRSVNVGDNYKRQELRTTDWKYTIDMMAPEDEAKIL
jgi:hypothetical protein